MYKNKKGQTGPIGAVLLFVFFLINWFVWLGTWLNTVGRLTIQENNMVGLEAFFYSNLNVVVFVCMLLGCMSWMYFGTQG